MENNRLKIDKKTYYKEYTRFKEGDIVVWYYYNSLTNKKEMYIEKVVPITKSDIPFIKKAINRRPIFTITLYSEDNISSTVGQKGWNPEHMYRYATKAEIILYVK